ncbi:cell division protein ZapE [Arthrobacter gandavensis]|uniref:cell division protein ZapE n=1 Tax=Arthrobacter gandavensis TaxID=169960 RepID=UPI00188F4666|nr:cell division protein ZapE [Arthrobacter gandavensis]MBF4993460.1 cell division protein ZapE [Arthrobacter gandavensis]
MTSVHVESIASAVRQAADAEGLELDAAQLAVLPLLARAGTAAVSGETGNSVYLWGPPGRGKTWLLDAFFEAVPLCEKRRLHFHDFFRELHARTFEGYGRKGAARQSAFAAGLDALLGDARLLCFDEFHVNGPADAAFVTRLLRQVAERGIVLVATSNYAPDELLPDPMFHHLFEPGIELITTQLQVAALDGPLDYRAARPRGASGFASGHHLREPDTASLAAAGLRPPGPDEATVLSPGTVPLKASRAADGQLWFSFADLCGARSAASDYLALAGEYRHWVVSGVPDTTHEDPFTWQRFGNLVDVLYDAGCRLDVLGFRNYAGTFPGTAHGVDLARISSRFGMLTSPVPV